MSTATRGHMRWLPHHESPQHGTLLARDLVISGASVLFSMWVTFAAGYAAVYEALVAVLIGVIFYAFLQAWRERDGQVAAPVEASPIEASPGTKGAAR